MTPARLSVDEYRTIQRFIARRQLHRSRERLPVNMFCLARKLGWTVEVEHKEPQIWASAGVYGQAKLITVSDAVSVGVQRACIAHVLGHELLGHPLTVDVMLPVHLNHRYPEHQNRTHDIAAWAVASMLTIPEWVVVDYEHPQDIAAICHCPSYLGERRIHGIYVEGTSYLSSIESKPETQPNGIYGLRVLRGGRALNEEVGT